MFNYESLLNDVGPIRDNPLLMIMNILIKLGVKEVVMAGFDGYTQDNMQNYYGEYIPLLYCQDDVLLRNSAMTEKIKKYSTDVNISSLTETMYFGC